MERKLTILNDDGLHARPAAILVKEANTFSSEIEVEVNGSSTNAKSIMSLMALGLKKDATFTLRATGSDAEEALSKLSKLIEDKFNLH